MVVTAVFGGEQIGLPEIYLWRNSLEQEEIFGQETEYLVEWRSFDGYPRSLVSDTELRNPCNNV